MVITWPAHSSHIAITWQSHSNHIAITVTLLTGVALRLCVARGTPSCSCRLTERLGCCSGKGTEGIRLHARLHAHGLATDISLLQVPLTAIAFTYSRSYSRCALQPKHFGPKRKFLPSPMCPAPMPKRLTAKRKCRRCAQHTHSPESGP